MSHCCSKKMTREEIFAVWSPANSTWSTWAKPVLFAHIYEDCATLPPPETLWDASGYPPAQDKVAVVLDLPGADGVHAAMALALRGYRPVPLYNALPLPVGISPIEPPDGRPVAAVNVAVIVDALQCNTGRLAQCSLLPEAPPVFLLDANRHGGGRRVLPDEFDNRSVCFTTDFPSANFLLANGIRRVLLVQKNTMEPQADLAHVLRRWQAGGLPLERMQSDFPAKPEPFEVSRPLWYGAMFQRALSAIGLHRATKGGFGAWMPESSAGG
jgi:hypothetical protein